MSAEEGLVYTAGPMRLRFYRLQAKPGREYWSVEISTETSRQTHVITSSPAGRNIHHNSQKRRS